jgi:serine/threonine protein phosphatase 1
MPQYAISDIHGHSNTFRALLKRLDFSQDDELFLLGDFIDRGPDSKGVIDRVIDLRETGHQVHCLRGNHEQLAIDAEWGNDSWQIWLGNGGKEACTSFGTYGEWYLPDDYLKWMEALPFHLSTEGYLMVHAGINTHKVNPLTDAESLLWARNWYGDFDLKWLDGRILLHGHTPQSRAQIIDSVATVGYFPVINIDNGCFAAASRGMNGLCALTLVSHELVFEEDVG